MKKKIFAILTIIFILSSVIFSSCGDNSETQENQTYINDLEIDFKPGYNAR